MDQLLVMHGDDAEPFLWDHCFGSGESRFRRRRQGLVFDTIQNAGRILKFCGCSCRGECHAQIWQLCRGRQRTDRRKYKHEALCNRRRYGTSRVHIPL